MRELQKILPSSAVAALLRTHVNTDIKAISTTTAVRSDAAGVFDPFSANLDVKFMSNDVQLAVATINGLLDTGLGTFHLSLASSEGDEMTIAYYGQDTDSVRAEVKHVESGKIGTASFSAIDQSVGGSTPGTISSGGGGGGGGGSK